MGVLEKFDYKDFTKSKHRIIHFIMIGLFAVILLFSIIALATGHDFIWGLINTVFSVVSVIVTGYNIPVTFNLKKDFSRTKFWTLCFAAAIGFVGLSVFNTVFSLIFMFKHSHSLMVATLLISIVLIVIDILTIILEVRDSGTMNTSA